jgi:hypothetical protein
MGQHVAVADQMNAGKPIPDYAGEIERDMYDNAGRAMVGPSAEAPAIANKIAQGARQAGMQPLNSLEDVRAFKSGREAGVYKNTLGGTPENTLSKANMAAADSARSWLDEGMRASGPSNYAGFRAAADDVGDAHLLEELTKLRSQGGGGVGDALATGVGAAVGSTFGGLGTLPGAAAGYGARKVAQEYGSDAVANLSARGAEGVAGIGRAGAAVSGIGGQVGNVVSGQLSGDQNNTRQLAGQTRGNLISDATRTMLERSPEELGQYASTLQRALQEGTLDGTIYRLYNDPEFRMNVYPKLQGLTAESSNGAR